MADQRPRLLLPWRHAFVAAGIAAFVVAVGTVVGVAVPHISEVIGTTRGDRRVKTLQLTGVRLRKTAVNRAAARRRLLHGRYLGWASGTSRYPHGRIGPAGERAVRLALADSGSFQPLSPYFGETAVVLGHKLSGSVDSSAVRVPVLASGVWCDRICA